MVDELVLALASRFALDFFTIQQDHLPADEASTLSDVELEQLGLVDLCEPSRLQSSARADVHAALACLSPSARPT